MITIQSFTISWILVGFLMSIICIYHDFKNNIKQDSIIFDSLIVIIFGWISLTLCLHDEIKMQLFIKKMEDK